MHMIDMSNGRANMAYVGETPWHGLGQELTADAPIETWVVEAGLNWTIESAPVTYVAGGKTHTIPKRRALHRSDTGLYLSTMSTHRYNVVQPRDILEFYRDLIGVDGGFQLETAGCIDDGKKIWALAKHQKDINVGKDIVKPYLMLATSCDGTLQTTGMFTTVRVVCNNTLQMSLSADAQTAIKVPHTRSFNAVEVKEQLGLVHELERDFAAEMEALCSRTVSDKEAREVFQEVYLRRDDKNNIVNELFVELTSEKLMAILKQGPGAELETAKSTAWGVLNAVTHFEDHHRKANSVDSRFRSAQFGDGAKRKQRTLELLAV